MPIAEGLYQHRIADQANDITEKWVLSQQDNGTQLNITFSSDYTLTATVLINTSDSITHFAYHIDDNFHGQYQREANSLSVERTLPGNTRISDQIILPDDAILDLPFVCCKPYTLLALQKQGVSSVFAPLLRSGDRAGDLAKKSLRFVTNAKITLERQTYHTQHYRYGRDYWLNEYHHVLRARQDLYDIILVEYSR
ncbi:MAG: hypothetical protein AAFN11_05720 [Chloroflexota bacterium]